MSNNSQERTLTSGLWNGVRNTTEPFDDTPSLLQDATNIYIPDPEAGSGVYARPGFSRGMWTSRSNFYRSEQFGTFPYQKGQCVYAYRGYTIIIVGGQCYYIAPSDTASTEFTPTNVLIDATARIFCKTLNNKLIVSDGVNPPWMTSPEDGWVATAINYSTAATVLSRATVDTKLAVASVTTAVQDSYGATTFATVSSIGLTFPAGTVPRGQWAAWRVKYTTSGGLVLVSAAANYTAGYATEALAIASVPTVTVPTEFNVGYVTLQTKSGGTTWIAQTDALQGGTAGNPASHTNYYAGNPTVWAAYGAPVIFTGALFFIMARLGDDFSDSSPTGIRSTIAWSEPNQPDVGYAQTNYDNQWTLTQTGNAPIYCLEASNVALYYFRQYSIGALQGAPGVDFRNTATHDTVSENIGCVAAATICAWGNLIYFADAQGRCNRFALGGHVEKLWLQNRADYEAQAQTGIAQAQIVNAYACAFLDPNTNIYCLFGWANLNALPAAVTAIPTPRFGLAYDALTGRSFGRWFMAGGSSTTIGLPIDCTGTVSSNGSTLVGILSYELGTIPSINVSQPATQGYLWTFVSVNVSGSSNSLYFLDSTGERTTFYATYQSLTTARLGYSTLRQMQLQQIRVVSQDNAQAVVTSEYGVTGTLPAEYTSTSNTITMARIPVNGDPVPAGATGRSFQLVISNPNGTAYGDAVNQWTVYKVEADATQLAASGFGDR